MRNFYTIPVFLSVRVASICTVSRVIHIYAHFRYVKKVRGGGRFKAQIRWEQFPAGLRLINLKKMIGLREAYAKNFFAFGFSAAGEGKRLCCL